VEHRNSNNVEEEILGLDEDHKVLESSKHQKDTKKYVKKDEDDDDLLGWEK
jgi:hypothetical protein